MRALVRRNPRLEAGISWRILYTFAAQYVWWCSLSTELSSFYKSLRGKQGCLESFHVEGQVSLKV